MSLQVRELTAPGRGGIGVFELTGPGARRQVGALAGGKPPAVGGLRLLRLARDAELLDEALCLALSEERVELHLHGSPAVQRRVLDALGAVPAPPGDSLEARAEALSARAPSEAAARILLDQAGGALRRELEALDLRDDAAFRSRTDELLERARVALHLIDPPRIVLAGVVNAGKSTLFNVLVGHERVVVSSDAGTTRDAIRELVLLGDYAVELVDVAGERTAEDEGESEPIPRALEESAVAVGREASRRADLILRLEPAPDAARLEQLDREPRPWGGGAPERTLISRADLLSAGERSRHPRAFSALEDPAAARRLVTAAFLEALDLPPHPWVPGRAVPFESGLARRIAAWSTMGIAERERDRETVLAR